MNTPLPTPLSEAQYIGQYQKDLLELIDLVEDQLLFAKSVLITNKDDK